MKLNGSIDKLIASAFAEDLGDGDHSSLCCIEPDVKGSAVLKVKQNCRIAGVDIARKIFEFADGDAKVVCKLKDGDDVVSGEIAFEVTARIHTILKCERLVLNTMQRMSGIATLTAQYVHAIAGHRTQLLDTRKTTPNFRLFEKEAVRIGGAYNHRMGLYDMIMLKDNHIDYCGSIEKAVLKARTYVERVKPGMKIEVEARSLEDVRDLLQVGQIDRIMLDNFSVKNIIEALALIQGKYETEASGGIHLGNIREYAATGVDFISCGALIHQAQSIDLSLKASIH
jgi:nicotinate-nucleotide pyrophosphorylase (carboxylating)